MGISPLRVRRRPGRRHEGLLLAFGRAVPVAIGRCGIAFDKREGDGRTPAGTWHVVRALWRADLGPRPLTRLPLSPIRKDDGWCDDPRDRRYNRPVRLPLAASHERMWRNDRLYDLVLVLDHNTRPRRAGRGSAVFLHVARGEGRDRLGATEGCVALRPGDLRRLVARLVSGAAVTIRP